MPVDDDIHFGFLAVLSKERTASVIATVSVAKHSYTSGYQSFCRLWCQSSVEESGRRREVPAI